MTFQVELGEREDFLELMRVLTAPGASLFGFFDPGRSIGIARAPGRLDVMGGIADYSGSLVLEMPIREAAFCAAQLHPEPTVRVVSVSPEAPHTHRTFEVPAAPLLAASSAQAYQIFRDVSGGDWAAYVAGPLVLLARERGLSGAAGVRIFLSSRVPEGKGVSSSAAIEVAALFALAAAANLELDPHEAALLCQRSENLVVGAPCGVMDPMTSALGRRGQMLELLCQPATVRGMLPVPSALRFFGIDSGVRHAVRGADYAQVRVGAFMGYRILADTLGLSVTATETPGLVRVEDPRYKGYLANLSSEELEAELLTRLPERMKGADFLRRYAGTTDPVTRVEAERNYPVRSATEHPIRENERVRRFAAVLRRAENLQDFEELGELMFESHESYSACGLGSDGTDRLVRLVREFGPSAGLYGAKVTGGGSGGTVAVLAASSAEPEVHRLAERYSAGSGSFPHVFVGSSAGAAEFGTMVISAMGL